MPTTTTYMPSSGVPLELTHSGFPASTAIRLSHVLLLAIGTCSCFGLKLFAQTSDPRTAEANKSWTATSDLKTDNLNPTRTIESYSQSGNRTIDARSIQMRDSDGRFEPYQDIERETLQVDANTVRITTRTFGRDISGRKALVQVTEEERHTLPDGNSNILRITSNPDLYGKLQPVQREIVDTKRIGTDAEETNTTVMLVSINGGLAPAFETHEVRKRVANNAVESTKTTLLPDGAGNWQVNEVRQATTRQEGTSRNSEERISRLDSTGKLSEVSRVVTRESESASGEKHNTVETYSVDVPGSSRDGRLHIVERTTSTQRSGSTGEQINEQQVERLNPGDPDSGLRVSIVTSERMSSGPSGEHATRTIRMRVANGSLGVVSVETTNSNKAFAIQVQQK